MKPRVYIFSIFPWESNLLHREHMLAKSFDRLGYKVYFVERSQRLFGSRRRMAGNIEVLTIFGLPYLKGFFLSIFKLNDWLIGNQLRKMVGGGRAWLILSSPLWSKSVAKIKDEGRKFVYDVSDNHLAFTTNDAWRKNLTVYEEYAIQKSDLVTVTSENLLTKLPEGKKSCVLENGVELESFLSARPILRGKYQGKIVGFIGGIYQRVKLGLVEKCAIKYPETNFVLIGPTDKQEDIKSLGRLPNFHYLGSIPWDQINDYFASLDVGVVPFVSEAECPWLKTVDSVKVYQYAYFGYPIVTTNYGRVKTLEPIVAVADDDRTFIDLVGKALVEKEGASVVGARKLLAEKHDWLKITEQMASEINSA